MDTSRDRTHHMSDTRHPDDGTDVPSLGYIDDRILAVAGSVKGRINARARARNTHARAHEVVDLSENRIDRHGLACGADQIRRREDVL